MATATETKPKAQRRKTVKVTEAAVKQQQGLIRNNKQRKRDGEPTVKSKNWKLAGLSQAQLQSILDGEPVSRDFKSGRKLKLTLG